MTLRSSITAGAREIKGHYVSFYDSKAAPALETPELQLALATYYTEKDKEKKQSSCSNTHWNCMSADKV